MDNVNPISNAGTREDPTITEASISALALNPIPLDEKVLEGI